MSKHTGSDPFVFAFLPQFFFTLLVHCLYIAFALHLHSLYLSLKVHSMFLKYKYLVS